MIGFWRILMNSQATPAHTLGRNGPGPCPGHRYAKMPGPKITNRRGSASAVLIAPERPMTTDLILVPSFVPEYLGSFGIDMREVLRQAGLSPMLFHGGKTRITTRDFFALWNAIEKVGAPADFGLRVGMADPPPGQYDVATMAALHSATFGEALAKRGRYKRLVCPEALSVEIRKKEARIQYRWFLAEKPVPSLLADGAFASTVRLLARGTGKQIAPLRVELTRRVGHAAMLKRHFGCEIKFNAPEDLLVFAAAVLDEPFRTHNPELLDLMVPGLESALQKQAGGSSWVEQTRERIGRSMRGQRPSVEIVAKDLCVSPRTLQRRLEESGTTYQQLLDEVRQDTARKLLAATDLESGEIAFLLGFEELNSFTRAFHDWEGATPMRWRAANVSASKVVNGSRQVASSRS